MSVPSYGIPELFQGDGTLDFGLAGNMVDFPVRAQQNRQSPDDSSSTPCSSLSRKRGSSQREFNLDPLSPPRKVRKTQGCRSIFPKFIPPSPEAVERIDDNNKEKRESRNVGRRTGPLTLKKRQKASRIRQLRACAACYLNKTPVSLRYHRS
jgi:hypothetical protein